MKKILILALLIIGVSSCVDIKAPNVKKLEYGVIQAISSSKADSVVVVSINNNWYVVKKEKNGDFTPLLQAPLNYPSEELVYLLIMLSIFVIIISLMIVVELKN